MSEYEVVMHWRLVIEDFRPNIQHVYEVYNIRYDTIIIIPSTLIKNYDSSIMKSQCRANDLLVDGRIENNKYFLLLDILNVQREQQKELRDKNSKLGAYMKDHRSA